MICKTAIFANMSKAGINEVVDEMQAFFSEKGFCVSVINLNSDERDLDIPCPQCDFAVSLGGDGTVLSCANILKDSQIPILAVNLGTFGYITETSLSEYKEVFESYYVGQTKALPRMRLNVSVLRSGKTVFEDSSLNDIVVTSSSKAKMAKTNLYINDTFTAKIKSDGIIVSTPTGSTAYNLSAGGPIIDASIQSIIINPICPFTMSARPLVVSDNSSVCIEIPEQSSSIAVSCDGHRAFNLINNDHVLIKKSSKETFLVKNNKRNSIEILRDKLGWAGGFNA